MLARRLFRFSYDFVFQPLIKRIPEVKSIRPVAALRNRLLRFRRFIIPAPLALLTFVKAAAEGIGIMAESLQNILENADQLFDENHYLEVLQTLDQYKDQNIPDIQWRKARALYNLSKVAKDKNERTELIKDSYEYIVAALAGDDTNYAVHKWMAIVLDAYAELGGIKSRVKELENVKKHMVRAVELNPSDATSWYLLGSFEFGLADMPWYQRTIVTAVFATPPTGSYEKSLEYFEKAESLKEGFYSMNWLMLGKAYLALKKTDEAKKFLEKAANCQLVSEDDKNCKEEASKILQKL